MPDLSRPAPVPAVAPHADRGAWAILGGLAGDGAAPARLDVHFIISLPVRQGNAYKAGVDNTPGQMVWGGDQTMLFLDAADGGSD